MFLGTSTLKFSGKGRIILPKKFRMELKKAREIILSQGLDGCIWGFSKKEWEKQAKDQLEIPITETRGRFLRRMLFASAESTELDHQGRFVIHASLMGFAQIKKEILLIGAGDHFEIWDPKKWKAAMKQKP